MASYCYSLIADLFRYSYFSAWHSTVGPCASAKNQCEVHFIGNESVPKVTINDTINL